MKKATTADHTRRIREVLAFIRDNVEATPTLAHLAGIALQSPYHFERTFQAQTGRKPIAHWRQLRLTRAAIRLRTSDTPIVTIALDAGYANHESFSRAFRRYFGASPREFRKLTVTQIAQKDLKEMAQFSVGLVKIPVNDFAAATQYYRDVIGLEEEFAVEAYGWAQYKVTPVPLCLYVVGMGGGEGVPGGEVGFHLTVAHLEAFHQEYLERGGKTASEIVHSADGGMFVILEDPDGNRFKVLQRIK